MMGPMAGPPPDTMPLPPELMGGMGPGGPPGLGPGGPGPGDGGGDPDEEAAWQDVVDALQHAMQVEKDPADKAIASKMLAQAHKLLADRDAEKTQAAGAASPALKLAMRQNR